MTECSALHFKLFPRIKGREKWTNEIVLCKGGSIVMELLSFIFGTGEADISVYVHWGKNWVNLTQLSTWFTTWVLLTRHIVSITYFWVSESAWQCIGSMTSFGLVSQFNPGFFSVYILVLVWVYLFKYFQLYSFVS